MNTLTTVTGLLFCSVTALGQTELLIDEFAGTSVDTIKWTVSLSHASSSVTVEDGSAEFRSRGRLLSVAEFPDGIQVTGRFQFVSSVVDQFTVHTRTTGVSTNAPGDFDTGVRFEVVSGGDGGGSVAIAPVKDWMGIPAVRADFPISVGAWYDFRIIDTGSVVYLFIEDLESPILSKLVVEDLGTRVGILNIESVGSRARLDYIRITSFPNGSRLLNLSTRGFVGLGGSILIPGFVVSGGGHMTVLVRVVGPTLGGLGVSDVLEDPELRIMSGDTVLYANDNWSEASTWEMTSEVGTLVGAFSLPEGSKDAAMVVTLPPGEYTVHALGKDGGNGVALAEVYEVR